MQIAHPFATLAMVDIPIIDILDEESMPCDYCGATGEFFDDDFALCPECGNEFWNMDYTGDGLGDPPSTLYGDPPSSIA